MAMIKNLNYFLVVKWLMLDENNKINSTLQ